MAIVKMKRVRLIALESDRAEQILRQALESVAG